MNNYQTLLVENKNGIWKITINRPESLNALNSQVLKDLDDCLSEAQKAFPKSCRAILLTGSGEKAFVAGADIKEMQGLTSKQGEDFSKLGQKVFSKIESMPVVVMAAVNGFALGGGLEVALGCDFIWASANARLGLPEVGLGVIPGFGGTVRLARVVGLNRAREMTLSGEAMKCDEAHRVGLVNRMFTTPAELLVEAEKFLEGVVSKGPLAVKTAKQVLMAAYDQNLQEGLLSEAGAFGSLFATQDLKEGFAGFVEKRKVSFTGE